MKRLLLLVALALTTGGWPHVNLGGGVTAAGGAAPNVLLGPLTFEGAESATCDDESDLTINSGMTDAADTCDFTASPLSGSESLQQTAVSGDDDDLRFENTFSAASDAVVCDFMIRIDADTGGGTVWWHMRDGAVSEGADLFLSGSAGSKDIEPRTEAGGAPASCTGTECASTDWLYGSSAYNVRIAYGATATACDSLGLTDADNDGDCVELLVDSGATWGSGAVYSGSADSTATGADGQIDGILFNITIADTTFDDFACCDGDPGGSQCGT